MLSLPLELRIPIYKELLSPNPDRVHILYHEKLGREATLGTNPAILRVS